MDTFSLLAYNTGQRGSVNEIGSKQVHIVLFPLNTMFVETVVYLDQVVSALHAVCCSRLLFLAF